MEILKKIAIAIGIVVLVAIAYIFKHTQFVWIAG